MGSPSVPTMQVPNAGFDSNAVLGAGAQQQGLTDQLTTALSNLFGSQQQNQQNIGTNAVGSQENLNSNYLSNLLNMQRGQNSTLQDMLQGNIDNTMKNLTSGPQAEAFKNSYNRLGLLDSGAFNTGLADQFGQLAQQNSQAVLNNQLQQQGTAQNALGNGFQNLSNLNTGIFNNLSNNASAGTTAQANAMGQGTNTLSGLGLSGLQRQFSLEDLLSNSQNASNLAGFNQQAGLQNALISGGANIAGRGVGGYMANK